MVGTNQGSIDKIEPYLNALITILLCPIKSVLHPCYMTFCWFIV